MGTTSINAALPIFPAAAIIAVLLIGLPLALLKPFRAYLFALFPPLALSIPTMTFTRFAGLGPYFNLYDACLVVMLLSAVVEVNLSKSRPKLPSLLWAMLGVLILGFSVTASQYGLQYETVRALRWGLNVPLWLFGGFVMLRNPARHGALLTTLLLAAITASGQHLFLVVTSPALENSSQFGLVRSSMFQLAKSEAWLLAGPYLIGRTAKWPRFQAAAAVLFLTAAITTQTRTLALGFGGGLVLYWYLFARNDATRRRLYLRTTCTVILLTFLFAIPRLNLQAVANSYSERVSGFVSGDVTDDSELARRQAFSWEGSDWIDGGAFALFFGNGLDYFTLRYNLKDGEGSYAFGHLGYITYLSQLGIVGFLVYACWFPISVIRRAKSLYLQVAPPPTHHLTALAGAAFLYGIVAFIFSGHYLANDIVGGTLAGFVLAGRPTTRRVR